MTHDEMIEAVAKAIGDTTDFDGDRMASRYADSELRDVARAAIRVIAPAVEQETVAKIVAWMRGNCMSGKWRVLASEIEEKWGKP